MMGSAGTMGGDERQKMQHLLREMERAERALADGKIDQDLLERQERIEKHLLEIEHGLLKSGEKEEREAEAPDAYAPILPASFEEYKRLKEKELELYRYVPIQLQPYYEQEVEEYFERLGTRP